jgi:hypothetical protein
MTQKTIFSLLLTLLCSAATAAQTTSTPQAKVNLIIDRETIRFAPQEIAQELRLVVTDQAGAELYDSGPLSVSTLDWAMRDGKGEAVKGGLYLYTLTIKSAAGELSQRRGYLIVNRTGDADRVYVATGDKVGIGASGEGTQLTVVGDGKETVGGAQVQSTASRTVETREGIQRDAQGRNLAEQAEPAQKNSAGGLGSHVKTNIPDDLVVNGNLIFTPAPARDITMQNNNFGLRFYGAPELTSSPAAAAIQFWGNNSAFPGQLYLDAGATNLGALIFRTAPTGGTIAERMRVTATGNLGIGTMSPQALLHVNGTIFWGGTTTNFAYSGQDGSGLFFEQKGGSTATSKIRLQSSKSGNANDYSQFFIDPNNGFSFMKLGTGNGNVGIGTTSPTNGMLHVEGSSAVGVYGNSDTEAGVYGHSTSNTGTRGISTSGSGVSGQSDSGYGVKAYSESYVALAARSNTGTLITGHNSNVLARFLVENDGTVHAPAYEGSPDFAEEIRPSPADKSSLEPGDVLVAASDTDRSVSRSRKPYSTAVLGVYSTAPGFIGSEHPLEGASSETIPMAIIGIVPCKVSAENGPVRRGDLLTTSRTPGHAMRCADRRRCSGAIVGKALAALDRGRGIIQVLVTLQ